MTPILTSLRTAAAPLGDRREIGPIGTAARVVGGLIAISLPIALGGFGWRDAAAALVALSPYRDRRRVARHLGLSAARP
jgi:hypothetical protein